MDIFEGYKKEEFIFENREAVLVFPQKADDRKSWAFKMEYWGQFIETETELLKLGYHIAFIKNRTRFASTDDCELKAKFAEFISGKYGLNKKCVPIGMSLGGAHSVNFAGMYPDLVEGIFLDAPVLNFCMYWSKSESSVWENEFVKAYPNVKKYDLLKFDNHPMNKLDILVENNIPIIILYGTQDSTVKYEDNGIFIEEAYKEFPELLKVIPRTSEGHHPHGLCNKSYIIAEYIAEHMQN